MVLIADSPLERGRLDDEFAVALGMAEREALFQFCIERFQSVRRLFLSLY
jgi:hypothetical protein